jgi:hypothetical protein
MVAVVVLITELTRYPVVLALEALLSFGRYNLACTWIDESVVMENTLFDKLRVEIAQTLGLYVSGIKVASPPARVAGSNFFVKHCVLVY